MTKKILLTTIFLYSFFTFSQVVELKGAVYNEYLDPYPNAIIKLSTGFTTTTNHEGVFTIKTTLPITLTASSIGYSKEILEITNANNEISLILKENSGLEQTIISASRTPERLFESSASVERISLNDIRKTPSLSFFESLENLKNIDLKTNSILLKSLNTKGFSGINNSRVVQLIDGVDNVFPAIAIAPGNMTGLVGLDVENVEILEGASSALYGSNAFNGVILIQSKNPFNYQGISAKIHSGVTSQDSGNDMFYHPSTRFAYKFNDYFAAKTSFEYYTGEEWHAEDYRNTRNGVVDENSNIGRDAEQYNGLNVYGDEHHANQSTLPFMGYMLALTGGDIVNTIKFQKFLENSKNIEVTRNGYKEEDLVDNRAKNIKFNTSMYYRPFGNEKLEIIWTSRFINSNSLFNFSGNKLSLKNTELDQHVLEFKGENFFLKGYTTISDNGDSYNVGALASILNEKPTISSQWYGNYMGQVMYGIPSKDARLNSNLGRLEPGTNQFKSEVNRIKNKYTPFGGAKFHNQSKLYHVEGNFDFSKYTDWAEIQVGASYRRLKLNSFGALTRTLDERINIDEQAAYTQIRKKFLDNRMKVTISGRYDKTKNYDMVFSPRGSVIYTIGENRNHNFRISAQTAFSQPTAGNQYASMFRGENSWLLGNTKENFNRFEKKITLSDDTQTIINKDFLLTKTGFTKKSFETFYSSFLSLIENKKGSLLEFTEETKKLFPILKPTKIQDELKPEQVISYETGYRGLINISPTNILEVDINGYFNRHKNFIRSQDVYFPLGSFGPMQADAGGDPTDTTGTINGVGINPFYLAIINIIGQKDKTYITTYKNSETNLDAFGAGISLGLRVWDNYKMGVNYSWNDYSFKRKGDSDYIPKFNTSKHNVKVLLGNENVINNIGFNIAARWQSGYYWQASFASGNIDARTVIDGQITYNLPIIKSKFRVGATNLLGKPYYDTLGNGKIGSIYSFSWIIND